MQVSVHLIEQSQPVEYADVENTYTKDGMYCVYLSNEKIHKFPVTRIWRVIEDYGFHGRTVTQT